MIEHTEKFVAGGILMKILYADIKVTFGGQGVEVKIEGDPEAVKAVSFSTRNGLVCMEGKLPGVEIQDDWMAISCTNGSYKVNDIWLDKAKKLIISISLPVDTTLKFGKYTLGSADLTNNGNNVSIENVGMISVKGKSFGSLHADFSGSSDFDFESVARELVANLSGSAEMSFCSASGKSSFSMAGSGDVDAEKLQGSLSWKASGSSALKVGEANLEVVEISTTGSGDVTIEGGHIGTLKIQSSGSSELNAPYILQGVTASINGSVDVRLFSVSGKLNFSSSGSCELSIERINVDTADILTSGSGDVTIEGGHIGTLTVKTSGSCEFIFEGSADNGSFRSSGMGDIKINSCKNVLLQKASGMGDIEIG